MTLTLPSARDLHPFPPCNADTQPDRNDRPARRTVGHFSRPVVAPLLPPAASSSCSPAGRETVAPGQPFDPSIRLPGAAETNRPPSIDESANQGRFSFMLNALTQNWRPHRSEGVFIQELELGEHYAVILVRLAAGSRLPAHRHGATEDTYVLSGEMQIAGQRVRAGDFHHADAGSTHGEAFSVEGCMVLMIVSVADYQNAFGLRRD